MSYTQGDGAPAGNATPAFNLALATALRTATDVADVPKLRRAMAGFWREHGSRPEEVAAAAASVWPDGGNARMGAALLLGPAGLTVPGAGEQLTGPAADDPDWRVQECLAKAFDWQCGLRGWKESEPVLEGWLTHAKANVRRAAAEGPRVWTRRGHFAAEPAAALRLLSLVRADASGFVRKSVGNAVSDISKYESELVIDTLTDWAAQGAHPEVLRHACRKLHVMHPSRVAGILRA